MAVHAASPQLIDAVGRLVTLLDHPDDVRILRPLLDKEILWRLLSGPHGTMLREVGLVDSRASRIGRAVAAVAYQVGYESPSQFTREYSRMFGRPPRDDLRRVREPLV